MEIQAQSISFSTGEKRIIDSISLDLKNNELKLRTRKTSRMP